MNARPLNWTAPKRGVGAAQAATAAAAKRCECTTACGDDERVIKGLVTPCALHAKAQALRVTLANTTATLQGLREHTAELAAATLRLVALLDRMEPDAPETERATDADWIAAKDAAKAVLATRNYEPASGGQSHES